MFRMYQISGRSETWNGGLFSLMFDFRGLDRWCGVGFLDLVEAGGAGAPQLLQQFSCDQRLDRMPNL